MDFKVKMTEMLRSAHVALKFDLGHKFKFVL